MKKLMFFLIVCFVLCSPVSLALIEKLPFWKMIDEWLTYDGNVRINGNISFIGDYINTTVVNYNITGDLIIDGSISGDGSGLTNLSATAIDDIWVNETREIGNQTFAQTADGEDVELRLETDVNENAFLYYMESDSNILGFRAWYDGSGGGKYKIDAIDGTGTIIPKFEIDRDDYDADFFVNEDLNNNNITDVECIELNSEYICSWSEVNSTASGGANSTAWSRAGTDVFLTNIGDDVGIGTTNPGSRLHLSDSIDNSAGWWTNPAAVQTIYNSHASGDAVLKMYSVTTAQARIVYGGNTASDKLIFSSRQATSDTSKSVVIDNDGNVGIGTTAPRGNLEIFDGESSLILRGSRTGAESILSNISFINDATANQVIAQIQALRDGDNRDGQLSFSTARDGGAGLSEAMRIDDNGNVGIGTTAPGRLLEINHPDSHTEMIINSRGAALVSNLNFYNNNAAMWQLSSRGTVDVPNERLGFYGLVGGATEILTLLQTGNIGIGDTNPAVLLSLESDNPTIRLADTSGTKGWNIRNHNDDLRIYETTSGTGSAEFNILANGYVGIGTTTPRFKLDVVAGTAGTLPSDIDNRSLNINGDLYVGAEGTNQPKLRFFTNANTGYIYSNVYYNGTATKLIDTTKSAWAMVMGSVSDDFYIGYDAATTGAFGASRRLYIDGPSGFVGLGGTTSPTAMLEVIGDANVTGWLKVGEDLNVTGNITAENVFLPQSIFSHTNSTIALLGANTWTNITFDQEDADLKLGINHDMEVLNHTFMFTEPGVYYFHYDYDVLDTSGVSTDIDVAGRAIYADGTEIVGSVHETGIQKKGIETDLTYPFMANMNAGDVVVFQFIATDADVLISTHGTFGDHPESAAIIIKKHANLP